MALIDLDKFIASFITEMKECSQMRNFSIPRCIKKALVDQGLDYKNGEIIKTQRRVSSETKESCYGMGEDKKEKELIRINKEQLDVINAYSFGVKFPNGTTHIPSECFFDVIRGIWRHYNYAIDIEDDADIDSLGIDMDKMIGEYIFRKTSN